MTARGLAILCVSMLVLISGCIPAPAERDWTFLVYMAADNNLDYFAGLDIKEMAAVGSDASLSIVVQYDPSPLNEPTKRLFIGPGKTRTLATLGETNTGRKDVLRDFLAWGAQCYPARHYALVLWNHGSGVYDPDFTRASTLLPQAGIHPNAVGFDDNAGGDALTTVEYSQAIQEAEALAGFHLDVLCFDACLMQMAEVAAELRDGSEQPLVDYMVGSAGLIPGEGYDYKAILAWLKEQGSPTAADFAKNIVTIFGQTDYKSVSTTLSALDLTSPGLATLLDALADLAEAIPLQPQTELESAKLDLIRQIAVESLDYGEEGIYSENIDLCDFAARLQEGLPGDDGIVSAATAIEDVMLGPDLIINAIGDGEYDGWRGLALLVPTNATELGHYEYYAELQLAQTTRWDEVIAILGQTAP